MSELVQEKRVLTFEELCPEWSALISQCGGFSGIRRDYMCMIGNKKRNLTNHELCIVGEAHGGGLYWSSDDEPGERCDECVVFSLAFFRYEDEEYYEKKKSEFVQHFNEVHIK